MHLAGANEFYGGYIPLIWKEKYPLWCSINGRTFNEAQIEKKQDLQQILDYCSRNNLVFALTLNAPLYLPEQYPLLEKTIEEYISIGGKHIIIADLGLIFLLNEKKYPVKIHLGTGGVVLNHYTAKFYSDLGIKSIILDRQLSIDEINKITAFVPEAEFDIFILIGKCPNIEGLCTFLHDSQARIWHCVEDYTIEGRRQKAEGRSKEIKNIWAGIKRTDACGLCFVDKLMKLKIHGFKIVGRGANTERKIKAIKGLKKIINISSIIDKENEFKKEAHNIYKYIFGHACSPMLCYFPFSTTTNF